MIGAWATPRMIPSGRRRPFFIPRTSRSGGHARGEGEGAFGTVQNVEVVARGTLREEVADLRERPVDADGFDDVGVFGGDFEARAEFRRERRAAHRGEALDLFQREHGHNAGDDRNSNAGGAAFVHKAVIHGVVEKELRRDEVRAGVDFDFERSEVGFEDGASGCFSG